MNVRIPPKKYRCMKKPRGLWSSTYFQTNPAELILTNRGCFDIITQSICFLSEQEKRALVCFVPTCTEVETQQPGIDSLWRCG